jgi:hypothetical protein
VTGLVGLTLPVIKSFWTACVAAEFKRVTGSSGG